MTDRRARLALSWATDGGDPVVAELVAKVGAEEAWRRVLAGALGAPVAARAAQVDLEPEQLQASVRASGIRFVVPGDAEWPAGLDDLGHAEPIQRRGGVPIGLWVRGPGQLARLLERSVAIVGSRAATAYGNGITTDIAADLAERGVTVVSGGAFGIDAAAHHGALRAGGRSIGVLACGVDVAYPPANAPLFDELADGHLLVSELPPGAHPTRVRFLARNRLIAAMASGTVVVEAAVRSGARNTAGWATECGRPLMAVPGSVYSRASAGPHLMIRSGQAVLVTNAAEVLELVSATGQETLPLTTGPRRATDGLSESQLAVYEAVSARRRAPAGHIALKAGVSMPSCLGALSVLETAGLVEGDARGWLATFGRPR